MVSWISHPTSFRNSIWNDGLSVARDDQASITRNHSGHPDFGHLTLLVFEAVLQVVCVSLPGYIAARQGLFDATYQKFLANLNVILFLPCLIFTKLASQLTADKLSDLAIIPLIFAAQTAISYLCSILMAKCFGFKKRQRNFVVAMGVFGNSNSLPISLVISLSQTLRGLHWDKVAHDNDDEVAARGILYLLIFQQLGQVLRWSWGYNVLLAPADQYTEEEGGTKNTSRLEGGYRDDESDHSLLVGSEDFETENGDDESTRFGDGSSKSVTPGTKTPNHSGAKKSTLSSRSASPGRRNESAPSLLIPENGSLPEANGSITTFPDVEPREEDQPHGIRGTVQQVKSACGKALRSTKKSIQSSSKTLFQSLPSPIRTALSYVSRHIYGFLYRIWNAMNPPLWAMLAAVIVASVPALQHLFFTKGNFVQNSVSRAIAQNGGVAVPLILVVLGGNLARNTLPEKGPGEGDAKETRNLVIAALVSRMVLPTLLMAPMLALIAKYVPISIVDDKIFVIVCFLLTGAPPALQLAQICQLNNVYMAALSKILFQGYVVWILPSTLVLVMCALEVVEWAGEGAKSK